jgi:TolA-binding protein
MKLSILVITLLLALHAEEKKPAPPPDPVAEVTTLKAQVATLQSEIADLKDKLEEAESGLEQNAQEMTIWQFPGVAEVRLRHMKAAQKNVAKAKAKEEAAKSPSIVKPVPQPDAKPKDK